MLYSESVRCKLPNRQELQVFVHSGQNQQSPRCLLVHGNPATMLAWNQVVPPLTSRGMSVAAVDLPGFGRSPRAGPDAACVDLDHFADCCIALADALAWTEPFFVAGHSHGGGVAQVMAARYPERVAGIVLIATLSALAHSSYRLLALPPVTLVLRLVGQGLAWPMLAPINKWVLRQTLRPICSPEPVSEARLEQELDLLRSRSDVLITMAHVTRGDPCKYLAKTAATIRCPVLIIHGARDALVPVEYGRALRALIGGAGGHTEMKVLPGAGHALLDYQADDIARLLGEFIELNAQRI
jgi:pimeloyl-ACP methyl ester carboxylesterase